jgi:Tfp pilus assembly protein FimT
VETQQARFQHSLGRQTFRRDRHLHRTAWLIAFCCGCALLCAGNARAAGWQSTLTKDPPAFPPLRSLRASYAFGWSGFTAATGEAHFTKTPANRFQLDGTGGTVGLARTLWKLDANGRALADADTLRPVELKQTESYRSKDITTHLTFKEGGVTSERTEGTASKNREFSFPSLYELNSAMLYLRSQSLKDGSACRVVVYPQTSAYLATVTVTRREKLSVRAGTYNAIRLDLKLNRIGKNLELEPYRKFRRATIWISDDSDRLLLRIEAHIFIGTVFAELQSVHFEN